MPAISASQPQFNGLLVPGALAAAVLLSATALFLLSRVVYNVFFHPLSKYPGPKLWATSRIPWTFYQMQGQATHAVVRLHERYGPVVRIAPDELSYTSGGVWKPVYGHRAEEMPKPVDGRSNVPPVNNKPNIFNCNRQDHQRFRRSIAHAFSDKALRDQESYIQRYVKLLMTRLSERAAQGPQNMVAWYNWTTFDIIGDLSFGEPFGCLDKADYHPWVSILFLSIKFFPWGQLGRYYGIPWIVKYITPRSVSDARIKSYEYAKSQVDTRLESSGERKDFMDYITKQGGDKSLSRDEIHNMAAGLIVAGSETTASLLSGMTYHLLNNPAAYARLKSEIRTAFPSAADITMLKADHLVYLHACLNESLRLYPPAPATFPRVVPQPGETIQGRWVPGGTSVGVNHLGTYTSEANFRHAKEFRPERWLDPSEWASPTEFADDRHDAFQPFSFGPRNCIGRNLAWAEMRLITAHLMHGFDMELQPGMQGWTRQNIFTVWEKNPLMVTLSPRKA